VRTVTVVVARFQFFLSCIGAGWGELANRAQPLSVNFQFFLSCICTRREPAGGPACRLSILPELHRRKRL